MIRSSACARSPASARSTACSRRRRTSRSPTGSSGLTEVAALMDLGLEGRSCAVTGASRGIGLAVAERLCAEGARVVLVARSAEPLEDAAGRCSAAGGEAQALVLDITEPDAGERILAAASERFGGLDVLVNNAGTASRRG